MEQQQQAEEIEVSFRLDGHGRTIATTTEESDSDHQPPIGQYESHSVMTELRFSCADNAKNNDSSGSNNNDDDVNNNSSSSSNNNLVDWNHALVDELLFDAEIADCGLMPRTFWVPSEEGFEPRCSLEKMALDVFQHHVAAADTNNSNYDPKTSGAEWWVQIRPSPEAGRYTMHAKADDDKDMAKDGISFHWDKDEDLRILCGGNTYVHPHLSTVTYLTAIGAPTLAMNIRINNMTGAWIAPSGTEEDDRVLGFLSWPKFGKHLCFDGRYLHAAPSDIMEEGAFRKQCELPQDGGEDGTMTNADRKKIQRRHRRVTFLVNIWLNYKPFGIKPFPETMINKLSGHGCGHSKVSMGFPKGSSPTDTSVHSATHNVEVGPTSAQDETTKAEYPLQRFHWPMGDCNSEESIEADVPLDLATKQALHGDSLRITWQGKAGVKMSHAGVPDSTEAPTAATRKTSETEGDATDGEKDTKRPRLDDDDK